MECDSDVNRSLIEVPSTNLIGGRLYLRKCVSRGFLMPS